jgi:CAAX protease family protein
MHRKQQPNSASKFVVGNPAIKGKDVGWILVAGFFIGVAIPIGIAVVLWLLSIAGISVSFDTALDEDWFWLLLEAGWYVGIMIVIQGIIVEHRSFNWRELGFTDFRLDRGTTLLLLLIGLYWGGSIGFGGRTSPLEQLALPNEITLVTVLASLVIAGPLAGVCEEVLFRGIVHRWIRQRLPFLFGGCVSAFLFALPHVYYLDPGGIEGYTATFGIWISGLVFAFLYERTGSLWPAIILHASNNIIFLGNAMLKNTSW